MRRSVLLVGAVAVGLGVVLAAVVGAWARSSSAEAQWVVRDLATLGGRESVAVAINEQGQVAGESMVKGGAWRAFLWQRGRMVNLGTLGGSSSWAQAINDIGQVVGSSGTRTPGVVHAFLWQRGRMRDLGTLGGRSSRAMAINARGEIVGWSETKAGAPHAFLWRAGRMRDLGTLGGRASAAVAINDLGQVVGTSETGTGRRAFLWQNGMMRDLGQGTDPGPADPGWWRYRDGPTGINNHGEIVGWRANAGYVWRTGRVTDIAVLRDSAWPSAINDHGQIVGQSLGHGGSQPATLWVGSKTPEELPNPFLRDAAGIDWAAALAINERGQIVGECAYYSGDASARYHAVLWTLKP